MECVQGQGVTPSLNSSPQAVPEEPLPVAVVLVKGQPDHSCGSSQTGTFLAQSHYEAAMAVLVTPSLPPQPLDDPSPNLAVLKQHSSLAHLHFAAAAGVAIAMATPLLVLNGEVGSLNHVGGAFVCRILAAAAAVVGYWKTHSYLIKQAFDDVDQAFASPGYGDGIARVSWFACLGLGAARELVQAQALTCAVAATGTALCLAGVHWLRFRSFRADGPVSKPAEPA